MCESQITAIWFTDGWARAYHNRAKFFGPKMPDEARGLMTRALKRMYASQHREDAQRTSVGKKAIWFPSSVTTQDFSL